MRSDSVYVCHILDSIAKIREYCCGITFADFSADSMRIDAVIRNFEIIGEAAANISEEFRSRHSRVPWQQMKAMRNTLIHQYFGVDVDILWQTIQNEINELEKLLKEI